MLEEDRGAADLLRAINARRRRRREDRTDLPPWVLLLYCGLWQGGAEFTISANKTQPGPLLEYPKAHSPPAPLR